MVKEPSDKKNVMCMRKTLRSGSGTSGKKPLGKSTSGQPPFGSVKNKPILQT